MTPVLFKVKSYRAELDDTFTIDLVQENGKTDFAFAPGQFNMLYQFGVGEVPISISGDPSNGKRLTHTIRAVGAVTEALGDLRKGDVVGVRGPFGTAWPVEAAKGMDLVIVTGGIGLAPLRPAIYHALNNRGQYGNIAIFYGARTPNDILYRDELEHWRGRFDLTVNVTVDHADRNWAGQVGVVTRLLGRGGYEPADTVALVCGPEVMMRHTVAKLLADGVASKNIHVSTERNMKCGIGFCGHCQMGSHFVCKDGPVFPYEAVQKAFQVREL